MVLKIRTTDLKAGKTTEASYTDAEAIALGLRKSDAEIAAELESEVQALADQLTINGDRDIAIAKATIDLVIAARDGQLSGKTQAEIRVLYRDRVVQYLRENRGI